MVLADRLVAVAGLAVAKVGLGVLVRHSVLEGVLGRAVLVLGLLVRRRVGMGGFVGRGGLVCGLGVVVDGLVVDWSMVNWLMVNWSSMVNGLMVNGGCMVNWLVMNWSMVNGLVMNWGWVGMGMGTVVCQGHRGQGR